VNAPAVSARALTKRYLGASAPAVDSVSFDLTAGSVVGLLGPNGAGKTTLVKLMCGVTQPTGGRVEVLGGDPLADAVAVKQQLAVVHQSCPVDNMLPALDNVRIAAAFRGLRWRAVRHRVDEMLAQFGLEGVVNQLTFTLSGGQRRRLQLIRVLLVPPQLLILDEPSAGLDVQGRRQTWELIGKLAAEHGTTVIWTSHYIEEIERNCSRVLIVADGRLLRDETPASLVDEFGERSVRVRLPEPADRARLLALVPTADGFLNRTDTIDLSGSRFDDHLADVVNLVRDATDRGATIEFRSPSLEDAYVALIEKDAGEKR
jgi:ABC-type multidrug transport system ATPase subunit